jgi:arylsulfatase A-like enzyme/Flp pilus assembly protein TadD
MRSRPARAVLIAIVGLVLSASCRRTGSSLRIAADSCERCNLLLITIDTLRSDRLQAFGGSAGLTPQLDRLANEGVRLMRAYASAPLTLPSHASILTATSPPLHGLRTNGLFRLGSTPPTLATVLKDAGYRTGAFVGSFVLDGRFGLTRGFDVYDDRMESRRAGEPADSAERRADDVIAPALDWIRRGIVAPGVRTAGGGLSEMAPRTADGRRASPEPRTQHPAPSTMSPEPRAQGVDRWFAWVHLYDPHEPYRAPEPYSSRHAPYDAEVAYTDAAIGRLIDALRAAGQLDSTIVAVAADHGESLGEHGERTHGVFVYDVTMRVPWILWAGTRWRGASDALVRLIDLAPTVLDLAGVARPAAFEGRSILRTLEGSDEPAPAYVEAMDASITRNWAPLTGIVRGPDKLIDLPIPELYDVDADPGERTNLFGREGERARTLQALLAQSVQRFDARGSTGERAVLSSDARQRLQALGYVAAEATPAPRVYGDDDDPKRLIEAANALNDALARFKAGARAEGIAAARSIAQAHPKFTTATGVLASMYHDSGDLPAAIATLEEIVRRGSADQSVMTVLAGYLLEAHALPRAASLLEAVTSSHPDYADAFNTLGVVYSRMGRHDRARAAFARVLELDPKSGSAYENRGIDKAMSGDLDGAIADLRRAVELAPDLAGAHNTLAALLRRRGATAEAIDHWRRALELNPRLYDALYNLGTVLYDSGRRDEARPLLQRFVAEAPPARYGRDIERLRRMLLQ